MTYVILDLEFNGAYSKKKNRFVSEIIEFGAVKCDDQLNIIDNFSALVTPTISKKLNSHVSRLTHIKMDDLKESNNTFTHVLSRFCKFLGDSVLMSWSTSDILVLMENYQYFYGEDRLPFLSAFVNLQSYCEDALDYHDRSRQMGLSACAELLGIGFADDALHRALTDAELTALCFQKLYDPERLARSVVSCDDDFYQRITFKNYNICDPKSPDIDRREFYFNCERCGRRAWRRGRWKVKNKSFRASFRCLKCRCDFEGRLTFKKTYDGVEIIRRTVELPLPQKQTQKAADQVQPAQPTPQPAEPPAEHTAVQQERQKKSLMKKPEKKPVKNQEKRPEKKSGKKPAKKPEKRPEKKPEKPIVKEYDSSVNLTHIPVPDLNPKRPAKPTDEPLIY